MSDADKDAQIRLAAARLILGDDLVARIVEDQWNASNELDDPWQVEGNSARFALSAAALSVDILDKICDAIKVQMMDLSDRRMATYALHPKDELQEILKGNRRNTLADEQTCGPLEGDPLERLRELLSQ